MMLALVPPGCACRVAFAVSRAFSTQRVVEQTIVDYTKNTYKEDPSMSKSLLWQALNNAQEPSERMKLSLAIGEMGVLTGDHRTAIEGCSVTIEEATRCNAEAGPTFSDKADGLSGSRYQAAVLMKATSCIALGGRSNEVLRSLSLLQDDRDNPSENRLVSEVYFPAVESQLTAMHSLVGRSGLVRPLELLDTPPHIRLPTTLANTMLANCSLAALAAGRNDEAMGLITQGMEGIIQGDDVDDESPYFEPTYWRRMSIADLYFAHAQVLIQLKDWDAAEGALSKCIDFTGEVVGDSHRLVGLPLTFLSHVYARTGRVVFAEALLRSAAKYMDMPTDEDKFQNSTSAGNWHASAEALTAWRMHQLLCVLPKREAEAERWGKLARLRWLEAPFSSGGEETETDVLTAIESSFGTSDALSGKGGHGKPAICTLATGQVFLSSAV